MKAIKTTKATKTIKANKKQSGGNELLKMRLDLSKVMRELEKNIRELTTKIGVLHNSNDEKKEAIDKVNELKSTLKSIKDKVNDLNVVLEKENYL